VLVLDRSKDLSYKSISKSFRTGRLERELQMIQLSATRCSFIAVLLVSLVSFTAIILCVASQRVFIFVVVVVLYFVIDSVRKLFDTPSYVTKFRFRTNSSVKLIKNLKKKSSIWNIREPVGVRQKPFFNG
jgi:hypothetical protein